MGVIPGHYDRLDASRGRQVHRLGNLRAQLVGEDQDSAGLPGATGLATRQEQEAAAIGPLVSGYPVPRLVLDGRQRLAEAEHRFRRAECQLFGGGAGAGIGLGVRRSLAGEEIGGVECREIAERLADGHREGAGVRPRGHPPGIVLGAQRLVRQRNPVLPLDRSIRGEQAHQRQPIQGQCAGLVGQDQVDRTQRLLGIQPAHQHPPLEKPIRPQPQHHGQQDGGLLWDGGDGRADPGQQVRPGGLAASESEANRDRDQPDGDHQQDAHQPIQLALQR